MTEYLRKYLIPGGWIGKKSVNEAVESLRTEWPDDRFTVLFDRWDSRFNDNRYTILCETNEPIEECDPDCDLC